MFQIHPPNDDTQEIGKIAKQWTGVMKEWLTDADTFSVTCKLVSINK